MSARSPMTESTEAIERELEALGEAPVSAAERAMLGDLGELGELGELEDLAEVRQVAGLTELAEPHSFEDLSELELHRAWRSVEQRLAVTRPTASRPQPSAEPNEAPRTTPGAGSPRRWLLAAVAAAAAAAVLVVIVRPSERWGSDPQTAAGSAANSTRASEASELGAQARASLKVLDDGLTDTQRADQIARDYQAQLEEYDG